MNISAALLSGAVLLLLMAGSFMYEFERVYHRNVNIKHILPNHLLVNPREQLAFCGTYIFRRQSVERDTFNIL
jgi:hypothetical protein